MSVEHHSPPRRVREMSIPDPSATGWDIRAVCRFFGGSRPLNASTVYRSIKKGTIPRPFHPSPGVARWVPRECVVALNAMIAERKPAVIA